MMMYNINEEIQDACVKAQDFEGFSEDIYECPAGFPTVGYGRNLDIFPLEDHESLPMTESDARLWLFDRMVEVRKEVVVAIPPVILMPPQVRLVLTDMAFNLGIKGLKGFKKMLQALRDEDYKLAAEELRDSKYYNQTGRRARAHYRTLKGL